MFDVLIFQSTPAKIPRRSTTPIFDTGGQVFLADRFWVEKLYPGSLQPCLESGGVLPGVGGHEQLRLQGQGAADM